MLQRPNHGLALEEAISNVDVTYPKSFLSALAHEALGDDAQARKEYEAALPRLEAEVEKAPARARQHSFLGRVYAGLGRKEEASSRSGAQVGSMRKIAGERGPGMASG